MRNHTQLWLMKRAAALAALAALTLTITHAKGLDDEWAFAACEVAPNGTATFIRTFQAGTTYEIIADGDSNARDVDLELLNSSGQVIRSDTRASKEARIVFRPSRTGTYTVRLKLASAYRNAICHVIFLDQDGGWSVPVSNVVAAMEKHLAFAATLEALGHTPRLVRLYGWVLRPGEETTVTVTGLSARPLAAIALGDNFARDIDLYVERGGRLLGYDEDYDAAPVCVFTGSSGETKLTVDYVSGTGASLVFLGIYE